MKTLLRRLIYYVIGVLSLVDWRKQDVVVLCYHGFSTQNWRFNIDPKEFEKQLHYLQKNYQIISPKEFEEYLDGKKEFSQTAVLLTIDDGYKDVMNVKEIFKKYHVTPLLFLLSDHAHVNTAEIGVEKEFLSNREVRELIEDGWSIGSHSATHPNLTTLSAKELESEIKDSKKELEETYGATITHFAFPRGNYNEQVIEKVQGSGYHMAFSMDDESLSSEINRLRIPRIGVDRTHTLTEFTIITRPLAIDFRKFIKQRFPALAV